MKTNNKWYAYPLFGCYYKLEDGELFQCPMNTDGTRDDNSAWVDFNFTVEPKDRLMLETIKRELESKE